MKEEAIEHFLGVVNKAVRYNSLAAPPVLSAGAVNSLSSFYEPPKVNRTGDRRRLRQKLSVGGEMKGGLR